MTPTQDNLLKQYPSFEGFLQDLHPDKLLAAFSEIDLIEQSISKKRVSLEDVNTVYAKERDSPAVTFLHYWLVFLNKFSNINKPLVDTIPIAFMIYKHYKHFYLTDLKLLFEKIMHAEYGTFYGSIDAQRILHSFKQYDLERTRTQNKEAGKEMQKYQSCMEKIEAEEKLKIWTELEKQGLSGEQKFIEFKKRCEAEIPARVQLEFEKLQNNQPDGKG
jgi:hypothetical protein